MLLPRLDGRPAACLPVCSLPATLLLAAAKAQALHGPGQPCVLHAHHIHAVGSCLLHGDGHLLLLAEQLRTARGHRRTCQAALSRLEQRARLHGRRISAQLSSRTRLRDVVHGWDGGGHGVDGACGEGAGGEGVGGVGGSGGRERGCRGGVGHCGGKRSQQRCTRKLRVIELAGGPKRTPAGENGPIREA